MSELEQKLEMIGSFVAECGLHESRLPRLAAIVDGIIDAVRAESQWVAVTERLPEDSSSVLVYFDDGEYTVAEYHKAIDVLCDGEWTYTSDFYGEITHWKPICPPEVNQ